MFKRLLVVALLVCAPVFAASKPATVPRWAETTGGTPASNIATPTSGESDSGWTNGQTVISSSKMNWLFRFTYDWILYLRDGSFTATASSALPGVSGTGDTNQPGVLGTGHGTGQGVKGTGDATTNGDGVAGVGTGTGNGVTGSGGPTGAGGTFTGGSTSGTGVIGLGFAGNSVGVAGTGHGTSAGVTGTGGTTNGAGVTGFGTGNGAGLTGAGAGSGAGVTGAGGTTGQGGTFTGGATSGVGVSATAGGSGSPVTGSLALTAQATPSGPSDGQVWYDTTVSVPRIAARVSGATSGTAVSLTLISGFTGSLAYYKDATGRVYLQGQVTSTGSPTVGGGTAITTTALPAGFRPGAQRNFVAIDNIGPPNVTSLSVDTTGHISFARTFTTVAIMTGTDAVSFLAEN